MKRVWLCLPLLLALLLGLALPGWSRPTIDCHCFKQRSFDPERPAAADDYWLTTSLNSYLAHASPVSKDALVRQKMRGAQPELLLLSHLLTPALEPSAQQLQQDLLTPEGKLLPDWQGQLPQPLRNQVADVQGAAALVQQILPWRLQQQGLLAPKVAHKWQQSAMAAKEMLLAALLAADTADTPQAVWQQVQQGEATWGQLLHQRGWASGEQVAKAWQRHLAAG